MKIKNIKSSKIILKLIKSLKKEDFSLNGSKRNKNRIIEKYN
jgi:hypothetical protein